MIAQSTRRTLDELPDNLLRDLGLERDDIPFVAPELAFADSDSSCNALRRAVAPRPLSRAVVSLAVVAVAAVLTFAMLSRAVFAQDAPIGRGEYLGGKVISANGQLV